MFPPGNLCRATSFSPCPYEALKRQNQRNPQDFDVKGMRKEALKEGNLMKQYHKEADRVSESDPSLADQLRAKAKQHMANRDRLNNLAAQWLFKENNQNLPSGTIDLHGLYVREAERYAKSALTHAKKTGSLDQLRFIVGKGIHSQNSMPRVKPAMMHLIKKHRLAVEVDPKNAGVLLAGQKVSRLNVGKRPRVSDRNS
ncbi:hypothetical protein PGT21_026328 [Puccinia graminis f. sp. tritici]|uniref:Smr domain-containing protein n=1 Tax=Puccinia graminis f. sp. tritici TaxID=56615 RepID=A0A5B0PK95_PUCGR|nr:hypothetical protein PGT21_026328 [Puccinia graminis f. sp. tritici]